MPKRNVIIGAKSNKRKSVDSPMIFPISGKGKSSHLLTARPYGSSQRGFMLFVMFIAFIFTLMSIYAISLAPTSPGAWGMLVVFVGITVLLLTYENNVFPDVTKKKIPFVVGAWFLAFLTIPFIVALFDTFNYGIMIFVIIFSLPLALMLMRIFMPEEQWQHGKDNVKTKIKTGAGKIKTGSKKKILEKTSGLKGVNRKKKIYRR